MATGQAPALAAADDLQSPHPIPAQEERPSGSDPSPELLAAQARLLALRAERGVVAPRLPRPQRSGASSCSPTSEVCAENWPLRNAEAALHERRRQLQQERGDGSSYYKGDDRPYPNAAGWLVAPPPRPQRFQKTSEVLAHDPASTVIVHPTMLVAMLREQQETAARVWLLLRAIDGDGQGYVAVDEARARLTKKGSPWRFCGWKRLRQLLRQGEGLFWTRDAHGGLWLHGAHRVAWALDLRRVQGFPVALPVSLLLGGIREVRAAFYAAFHSGRDSKPISRDTLQTLTGLAPRTQLDYDRVARVAARRNLALGDRHSTAAHQERAWQRGRGVFHFVDVKGQQGRPLGEYVAWHLPNSYEGPHARRSRGHRRRLNRKLADLVNQGIPGNGESRIERVFWPDGSAAAKGFNRAPQTDAYWSTGGGANGRIWHVLGRVGERC